MNTATFDLTDPATAEALKDCEVGVPKTIQVTITPTAKTDAQITADVTEVGGYVEEDMEEEEPEEMEPEDEMPMRGKGGKKMPGAVVAIMIGKGKK